MKKISFSISGHVLDEDENGIECQVDFDGYQGNPIYNTKEDGYFIFEITGVHLWDILFKHFLLVWVKTEEKKYKCKIWYWFRIYPNTHTRLKIYPFSKTVRQGYSRDNQFVYGSKICSE